MISSFFSHFIHLWVLKKSKEKTNIYILPSRQGLLYLTTNFLIFLVGLTYASNAVLLISFILVSFFIMIMIRSHFATDSIMMGELNFEPGHSDTGVICKISFKSKYPDIHFSLFLPKSSTLLFNTHESINSITRYARGNYSYPYYKLESKAPIGLFKTWRYIKRPFSFFIYPQRLLDQEVKNLIDALISKEQSSEYQDHIRFEKGMSPRAIDWKRYSKNESLLIKRYCEKEAIEILIDYDKTLGSKEERISKMSWTISYCLENSIPWRLKTQTMDLQSQSGLADYHKCNERLSLL